MKNTIKILITLIIFTTLPFTHIHAKTKTPAAESGVLGRVKNLFGRTKQTVNDKLQSKKKKMPPKKKNNTLVITLGLGIVITIGGVIYWKFYPKENEHNNEGNQISVSDTNALKNVIQTKKKEWFGGKDITKHIDSIVQDLQNESQKGNKKEISEDHLETFIRNSLSKYGINFGEGGETPVSGIDALRKIMNARNGKVFHGYDFYDSADKIIKDLKSNDNEMTIEDLKGPIIEELVKGNFDITKQNETGEHKYLGKHFINQVEHGLIDGGLYASDTAKVLEVLVLLAIIELKGEEFVVKNMLNDQNSSGDTVLHNLVGRCDSIEGPDTSSGTSLNCTPHIRMLIRYGADPTIKNNNKKSAIDLGKEKKIRCNGETYYINIYLGENTDEGVRRYNIDFASKAGGDLI